VTFGPLAIVNVGLFVVACIAPVLVVLLHLYDRGRRRTLTRRLGELPVIGRVMASSSPGRRMWKDALILVAITLVLFAASRPQLEGSRRLELRGLDLVLAVDVSKSMLVDDVGRTALMEREAIQASRLARARELATAVMEELPGDRIAPMVFAGATSHLPVTDDHLMAAQFLADMGPNDLPPGSNLAEVFRVARCLLRPDLYEDLGCNRFGRRGHGGDPLPGERKLPRAAEERTETVESEVERGKAIVVFTDGGDADTVTLREVATARELGVAVFIVGVGTTTGGIVYDIDPFNGRRTTTPKRDESGATVISRRDDRAMKAIAAAGGDEARFIVAAERGELDPMAVVTALRAINRGVTSRRVREMQDIYQPFLFAALMLLLVEAAIATRRRRRFPEAR
jgi:Ca-activated chloride channel homolog